MIRIKIFAAIIASILVLVGITYVISQTVLQGSFDRIETKQMESHLARVEGAFTDKFNNLYIKLIDWAQWDDTYQFIEDHNEDFIVSNLADESLLNLQINLMTYINTNNEVVFSKLVDLETGTNVSSENVTRELREYASLLAPDDEGTGGFVALEEGIMLVMSAPVLHSDGSGPKGGTLIFGRFLDEELLQELGDVTQLSLQIFPYDGPGQPNDIAVAQHSLSTAKFVISPLSDEMIAGYFLLRDLRNDAMLIVRISTDREVTTQGATTINAFLLLSTASIALFGIIVLLLLEHFLLRRFAQLSTEVSSISMENLSHAHVHVGEEDDVGKLAILINHLLDELARYQRKEEEELRKQREENEMEKVSNESLRKSLEEKAGMNKLMVERELKMIELKKEVQRLEEELARSRQ